MGVIDRLFGIDKIVKSEVEAQTAQISKAITSHIDTKFEKSSSPSASPSGKVLRYQFDPLVQQRGIYSRKKPDSSIPYDVLRKFSVQHEVSRAAINYRKRQLSRLDWEIVAAEKDSETIDDAQAAAAKQFFKQIGGAGNKYRKFMARVTEDLLVLDALSLYKQPTRGGDLFTLLPVDPTTIRIVVDDTGSLPLPPDPAYKQVIRGEVKAEFTTDEMIYDMINPRSNSPYGLAPLESLMIVVSSSLKAGLWNLGYMTEGNIPEGFFGVPKDWTPQMINDFQENWDAIMSGDEAAMSKLRFVPEGSYTPSRKMTDMAWESFNEWLVKVTCALFDVDPNEIGFKPKHGLGGKGMAEQANQTSDEKGLEPLAAFFEEIFTEVIQNDLGFTSLAFHFTGLDQDKDAKLEAEVAEILIRSGQRTINELRTDEGLEADPSPQADQLMITTGTPTFLQSEEEIAQSKQLAQQLADNPPPKPDAQPPAEDGSQPPEDQTQKMVELVSEFRKFRKMAIARKKAGKIFRPFNSELLPEAVVDELNDRIAKAADADDVRNIFSEFMQDYQINFIADVIELQGNLQKILR